ncbi:WbqC family protein [Tenacibaculum finnmarkense]|uniref:WbqC family protein n=1 Tax=Tenacibaculum finnmarkense TaxID=2781243 RepID=UPI001E469DE5|nr:WbqC family protein [Tenacibaculum finnmarkense]MCD8412042.1 WbqC family protein [Tenacibaculum finnmarkense genomovar ulcerans]MCG8206933.1 WbqC family protein [Tenacibaculum finnmarkense genomovar finnmarkense]MCG8723115.1 WbqC family protein [Tenacibaculum finnmarkense]MCG8741358.1 WbqC family protein [Tenacibaculum finnmarkense]MCG8764703.1 WbqC family protein [Tenacibaculum finnmarkense]
MALFIPTYFAPISQYAAIYNADSVVFELEDNYQKQTYRNRCAIYAANGKLSLNIPVKHLLTESRKKSKDTLVENDIPWQQQHFKSLQSAYKSSPFFEFFEDDIAAIFHKKYRYLQDVNIDTHLFIADALQIDDSFTKTVDYQVTPNIPDYRNLAIAKKGIEIEMEHYIQIFDDKHGFMPNLSILDLLFMEGPNASTFLENIKI